MNRNSFLGTWRPVTRTASAVLVVGLILAACEMDSWLDPSEVGRWERTPVILPILDRLDVIDQEDLVSLTKTPVMPEDLIPDVQEYVIGPSDYVSLTVFELINPGVDSQFTRRVDETGMVRLPIIGAIEASDLTPSQLEQAVATTLMQKDILRDPTVSVTMLEARQRTYSIVGAPEQGTTAFGTYVIPMPNFRLLDALALARGVSGRTKTLLIFRAVSLSPEIEGKTAFGIQPSDLDLESQRQPAPANIPDLIDQILEEPNESLDDGMRKSRQGPATPEPPTAIDSTLDHSTDPPPFVYAGGQWVRVEGHTVPAATSEPDEFSALITQRVIEVPYDKLINGDMRYNLVIRPGDIIRVPDRVAGFVYLMGAVNRPGAYTVPGENELNLKQLIASGGNLSTLAIPERVDLIRRSSGHQEIFVRLNLRAIFEGNEPDIFLKPNDLINVGTNSIATPLAVFRNGIRATYGFGFVLDRNFGFEVFPP